jgi:hypothetical protein
MRVGIAGTDERKRIRQAQIGIAGEVKGTTLAGTFGISGLNDRRIIAAGEENAAFGISGLSTNGNVRAANMGVAGNMGSGNRQQIAHQLVDVGAFKQRDETLARISKDSNRLGDRAAREAWRRGVWFADFTYVMKADGSWRAGREQVFGRKYRQLPFYIDSCGFRRVLTETAPNWAKPFEVYPMAIENLDPDGYAAWDNPRDRKETMHYLRELINLFPDDSRLWPAFSVRWAWDNNAHISRGNLPGWASNGFAHLIPLTETQRPFKESTREMWARAAIANALALANDPDFLFMVERFGKVMIGGMVNGPCPRMARHLFAATLCYLFPECHFWLLGQANFAVINGLGMLGLLEQVWTDGTWWIKDATADRFAVVKKGLITMFSMESNYETMPFFTLIEMMAANLRSLLAAYEGLWAWPPPEPLPTNLIDRDERAELKKRLQTAQLELGL